MSTIAAAAGIADRIDYWIRQHVIPYCQEAYPRPSQNKWNPARHRRDGLTAIGQCLKDQYDALATPVPPHLAALVKQLERQETLGRSSRHRGGLSAWSRARERLGARLCQPSRVETIGVGAPLRHLDETAAREHLCRSWRAAVAASVELDGPQHVPHRGGHLREIVHLFQC
jgi:hypothetical protein